MSSGGPAFLMGNPNNGKKLWNWLKEHNGTLGFIVAVTVALNQCYRDAGIDEKNEKQKITAEIEAVEKNIEKKIADLHLDDLKGGASLNSEVKDLVKTVARLEGKVDALTDMLKRSYQGSSLKKKTIFEGPKLNDPAEMREGYGETLEEVYGEKWIIQPKGDVFNVFPRLK